MSDCGTKPIAMNQPTDVINPPSGVQTNNTKYKIGLVKTRKQPRMGVRYGLVLKTYRPRNVREIPDAASVNAVIAEAPNANPPVGTE